MDNRSLNLHHELVTQAAEFFVEFRTGGASPTERARFQQWLRASPEHVRAYLDCAAGWSQLPTADLDGRFDLQAVLAAARADHDNVVRLDTDRSDVLRPRPPRRIRVWASAGSLALLLIVLAGTGIWTITQDGLTYKTGVGEQRTIILADGSTVTLNALTTVRVHLSQQAREITLVRGQAYFHDTDGPTRPFIVRAGKSLVRAIGTKFDVDEDEDSNKAVVTVLEGQVAVGGRSFGEIDSIARRDLLRELARPEERAQAVLVAAGEQVTIHAQNIPAPIPANVTAVTAWMQQRLVFDHTPLSNVAEQFNLYSKRRLVIADPSLRGVALSGEYSATDLDTLIRFLRSQPTLKVVERADTIVVTKS
jgi:transmembrane sensor